MYKTSENNGPGDKKKMKKFMRPSRRETKERLSKKIAETGGTPTATMISEIRKKDKDNYKSFKKIKN